MLPEISQDTGGQLPALQVTCARDLSAINGGDWDRLNREDCPFLSYAFLAQLEERGLVGPGSGWRARHAIVKRKNELIAAMPIYAKEDSFGEFVFDWAWAEAYERWGKRYYPKLVVAVPFTPVPGPRLLAECENERNAALPALLAYFDNQLAGGDYSSMHVLFPQNTEIDLFDGHGFLPRLDCRFLWHNRAFDDFEDFLQIFNARQRKNIRRERRKVRDAGVTFEWLRADELNAENWSRVHAICASTFLRRGQLPYLDAGFFSALAERMPQNLLVNVAWQNGEIAAAAIFFRDRKKLYGRYWGSLADVDCLHFECCYYQGIEYAIAAGLEVFDPGTQGEHKLRRGFAPVESWSLHRFANSRLGGAIAEWLSRERRLMKNYIRRSRRDMPFTDDFVDGNSMS